MEYENGEWSISLKDMCFYLLLRWKKIIVCAIVAALLMGGFQAVLCMGDDSKNTEELSAVVEEQEDSNVEALLEDQRKYMQESILMRLDTYNSFCAKASVFASYGYQIMPELEEQQYTHEVLQFYEKLLNDSKTLEEIAKQVETETEYLSEVVSVVISDNWLEISVLHYDKQTAEQVLTLLIDNLNMAKDKVTKRVGEHSIDIMTAPIAKEIGEKVNNKQTKEREYLSELEAAQNELNALHNPTAMVTSCIKMMIIGFIAGGVLSVVLLCVIFIFSDKVYSGEELERRLGVRIIGKISNEKRIGDPVTRWFRRLEGRIEKNTQENFALIAERINCCTEKNKVVAIAEECDGNSSVRISGELNKCVENKFAHIGCVLEDVQALRSLADYKEVVLVVYVNASNYKNVVKELSQLNDADVKCIGCILVE